jgi:hypothetical protein
VFAWFIIGIVLGLFLDLIVKQVLTFSFKEVYSNFKEARKNRCRKFTDEYGRTVIEKPLLQQFIGKHYAINDHTGFRFTACTPVDNKNVVKVIRVEPFDACFISKNWIINDFDKVVVQRVDNMSKGSEMYKMGDIKVTDLIDAVNNKAARELTEDEIALMRI